MDENNTIKELTTIIKNKNDYIAGIKAEKEQQASFFRKELKKLYSQIDGLEAKLADKSNKTYTITEIAKEVDTTSIMFIKTLVKAGYLQRVQIGSAVRIHLTPPYQGLGCEITVYGDTPTYQESTFYHYTDFGRRFLINAYTKARNDAE